LYSLHELGWSPFFSDQITESDNDLFPARVGSLSHGIFRLLTTRDDLTASLAGRLQHQAIQLLDLPVVGDWVLARSTAGAAVIERILERRTKLSRIASSDSQRRTEEQALATNVDLVFLVTSFTREFNPRRIERHLTQVWESGARPVIVINKADLAESTDDYVRQVEHMTIDIVLTSAATGDGIDRVRNQLSAGETAVLIGSSGVGKSSLINRLLGGEVQSVQEIRAGDARGRHTTSSRDMILVPGGGIIIDTPGLRELQVLADPSALGRTFSDVENIAGQCAFRDCTHVSEPACAVLAAVDDGSLEDRRLQSYRKLQRELAFAERRTDRAAQLAEKKKWKQIHRANRRRERERGRGR
jgi:ribosome biogenesis GTPase